MLSVPPTSHVPPRPPFQRSSTKWTRSIEWMRESAFAFVLFYWFVSKLFVSYVAFRSVWDLFVFNELSFVQSWVRSTSLWWSCIWKPGHCFSKLELKSSGACTSARVSNIECVSVCAIPAIAWSGVPSSFRCGLHPPVRQWVRDV